MNGERFARVLTGLAVLAVAVVAGIVSFSHIEGLALAHGYTLGTARLLPVSVDGLIVAASLACLTEARARGEASRLSRAGLVLGILATLAANVAAGAHFGIVGALVNAWPAVAFIVASEILLRLLRAARGIPSAYEAVGTVADEVPPAPVTVPVTVAASVPGTGSAPVPVSTVASVPGPVPVARVRAAASGRASSRAQPIRQKSAEKAFAAELAAGELPSLRAIKAGMHCGTDRARVIRGQLAETLQEVPEAA